MDTLTEHEMEVIVQRLETFVTDLEHDGSIPTLYAFVLLAQECAGMKHARYSLAHIRRCLALAHRMRTIRDRLVSSGGRWTPLHDVGEVLHAEATRLSSLYGVARPACRTARRTLQQAFRAAFRAGRRESVSKVWPLPSRPQSVRPSPPGGTTRSVRRWPGSRPVAR